MGMGCGWAAESTLKGKSAWHPPPSTRGLVLCGIAGALADGSPPFPGKGGLPFQAPGPPGPPPAHQNTKAGAKHGVFGVFLMCVMCDVCGVFERRGQLDRLRGQRDAPP